MTRNEYKAFLGRRLKVEQEQGFRHCAVMLAEIIEVFEMVDAPKKKTGRKPSKRCMVCGDPFFSKNGEDTCPTCVSSMQSDLKDLARDLAYDE